MTHAQLVTLQNYVAAVVRVMTRESGDAYHSANVELLLDAKKRLESAFGQSLDPPYNYGAIDLFAEVPAPKSVFPDIL